MEKLQLERREKIAAAIVLSSAGLVALWAKKEGKIGVARRYPGGSVFVDIVKEAAHEAPTRLAFFLRSLNPLSLDFGDTEHSNEVLDEVAETFDITETE